jgi:hypothetical protein
MLSDAAQFAVAEYLAQGVGEFFRRAIFLQEFGDDILADETTCVDGIRVTLVGRSVDFGSIVG